MSDLTPNHKAGEPLAPIDGESLQAMANKNTETQKVAKRSSAPTLKQMVSSAITPRYAI